MDVIGAKRAMVDYVLAYARDNLLNAGWHDLRTGQAQRDCPERICGITPDVSVSNVRTGRRLAFVVWVPDYEVATDDQLSEAVALAGSEGATHLVVVVPVGYGRAASDRLGRVNGEEPRVWEVPAT
jgi:hypothetical protein